MASRSSFLDNAHFLVRCLRYRLRTEKASNQDNDGLQLTGATVLDIGSKQGNLLFLDDARGWTFRPRHRVRAATGDARCIERQKRRFNWSNLRVMNVALSDLEGEMSCSAKDRRRKRDA
jgi:hypothetical protein